MNVTRVLHGPDVETITMPDTREIVESGQAGELGPEIRGEDCSYDIFGREDDLYFLNLTKNAKGESETSSCAGSSALATLSQEGILQPIGLALIDQFGPDALEPSGPLAESSDKDLPIAIILPLAFLVPIGVLQMFSLIKPKGGGR